MDKKLAREIVESLPSLYPSMTADEEEAIWTLLATDKNVGNNEDCINRKQALAILYDFAGCIVDTPNGDYHKAYKKYHDMMEQLPPAQPKELDTLIKALGTEHKKLLELQKEQTEQRTGRWQITDAYPHNVYCSECHKKFAQTHWAVWEDGSLPRNFCPHCGAKMNQSDKTCDCYHNGRCVGTKEIDPCSCGGNKSKCDFYEHVRREGEAE